MDHIRGVPDQEVLVQLTQFPSFRQGHHLEPNHQQRRRVVNHYRCPIVRRLNEVHALVHLFELQIHADQVAFKIFLVNHEPFSLGSKSDGGCFGHYGPSARAVSAPVPSSIPGPSTGYE